jgi:hypothetical protein
MRIVNNLTEKDSMKLKKHSRGLRKFIRLEKGRIRREFSDLKEQDKRIEDLYNKTTPKSKIKDKKQENDSK